MSRFNLTYNRGGEVIEILIRDNDGNRLDKFKCTMNDFPKILKIIKEKYGLTFEPTAKKPDKDLDWLKG